MSQDLTPADPGTPDLKVAGFELWVHRLEFPEIDDYWDGNWLVVSAHGGAPGADVWVHGPILMNVDIARFGEQCAAMHRGDVKSATLNPIEPNLELSLEFVDRLGHIGVRLQITPDHLTQSHTIKSEVDQSYLPRIADQCAAILEKYPIRGRSG